MSMEQAAAEEARAIMEILEGPRKKSAPAPRPLGSPVGRHASPSPAGTRSPIRSMLDISDAPAPARRNNSAVRSMLDIGDNPVSPPPRNNSNSRNSLGGRPNGASGIRSMLDSAGASSTHSHSTSTSPTQHNFPDTRPRRASDAPAHSPSGDGPRYLSEMGRPGVPSGSSSAYGSSLRQQFEIMPTIQANAVPLRVSHGGRRSSQIPNSMASVMSGIDVGGIPIRGNDRGRNSIADTGIRSNSKHSSSPSGRFGRSLGRSQSPHSSKLNNNNFNLMPDPRKIVGESGKVIDLDNAYRRLSNDALARSSAFSNLPARAPVHGFEHVRTESGESVTANGGVRLQKDYHWYENRNEDDEEALVNSSEEEGDDEDDDLSSGGEGWGSGKRRGRGRSRKGKDDDGSEGSTLGMGAASGPRQPKSLLAASEEERKYL
jgi:hypothetical protein